MVIPFACHCKNNKICDSFLPLVSYPNERHFRNYRFPIIKNSLSERRFFRMTWRLIFGRSLSIITPSVQFSRSVVSDSLRPHWLQYASPPCPSPTPRVHSNSCLLSQWCHPTLSSSVFPFSLIQSFPASGSFPKSQLFASGGQRIGVSALASVHPMNIQDWFPLGWTGWISLQSKGLSRVFSNTTVQKHQFFGAQLSWYSHYILTSPNLLPFLLLLRHFSISANFDFFFYYSNSRRTCVAQFLWFWVLD